jgi:hypothetical protein
VRFQPAQAGAFSTALDSSTPPRERRVKRVNKNHRIAISRQVRAQGPGVPHRHWWQGASS